MEKISHRYGKTDARRASPFANQADSAQTGPMKTSKVTFRYLASGEKALDDNLPLKGLLSEAFQSRFQPDAAFGEIQRAFLLVETATLYQHFGLAMFSPMARELILPLLAARGGFPLEDANRWFDAVFEVVYEDLYILKAIAGEPDATELDTAFAHDFLRRIACSEGSELELLALHSFDSNLVESLRDAVARAVAPTDPDTPEATSRQLAAACRRLHTPQPVIDSALALIQQLQENPLRLLVWRVEYLVSFSDLRLESKVISRTYDGRDDAEVLKVTALLAALLPHQAPDGTFLLPESPLSLSQLESAFFGTPPSNRFDVSLLRNWLGPDTDRSQLHALLQRAQASGLVLELPVRRNKVGYALSLPALRVLRPYHKAITEQLLAVRHEPAEEAPKESLPDQVFNAWIGSC